MPVGANTPEERTEVILLLQTGLSLHKGQEKSKTQKNPTVSRQGILAALMLGAKEVHQVLLFPHYFTASAEFSGLPGTSY